MYRALEQYESLDLIDEAEDCACAIFFYSGIKEIPKSREEIAQIFGANLAKVNVLLSAAVSAQFLDKKQTEEEKVKKDE